MEESFGKVKNVSIDAHPLEQAIVVKYQADTDGDPQSAGKTYQKLINLKDLSDAVDLDSLSRVVMEKCALIPERCRSDLEQTLFYLQRRAADAMRSRGSVTSLSDHGSASSIKANPDKIEDYMDLFYEDISEKTRGAACILELASDAANLQCLADNESLMGALVRIFREDWKKNFDLATNIVRIFVHLSYYAKFQPVITQHKMGALCMQAVEHELKRGDLWKIEAAKEGQGARKFRAAIRKQHTFMAACIALLSNIAEDLAVEQKMVRREVLPLLLKCLEFKESPHLLIPTVQFLLKLSIFEENKSIMEQDNTLDRLIALLSVSDDELRKYAVRLLFNLTFDERDRERMVAAGIVTQVAPIIQKDSKALNLMYQLTINDDAKAMITYTDAIQMLMADLLAGQSSDVGKAILINACVEKRNAQLVCGSSGQGLDLLMDQAIDGRDLLVAKILRNIAAHSGPTQEMFVKWMPKLLMKMVSDSLSPAEESAALGLESAGTAACILAADWARLCTDHKLVPWMGGVLSNQGKEREPLQLQIVIMCGTMSTQLEAARLLVPLLDIFLQLLHVMQEDDEFVVQLLYLFLQLIRHKELSDRLMGPQSVLGDYIIDLMHDKNEAIREMCENALIIIGEHSVEWARRIATQRFRWHNAQWLEMVESGGVLEGVDAVEEENEEWERQVIFDDDLIEENEERLF